MTYFAIETIVLEKYINELSSDAFKVLLKMIYLARTVSDDVSIRNAKTLRKTIGINITSADSVWKELVNYGIVIEKEHENAITYVLNGRKIRQDNSEFSAKDHLRNIRVTVFTDEQKQEEQKQVSDEFIKQKIQLVLSKPSSILIESLLKTIKLIQRHCMERDKRFTVGTIAQFLLDMSNFDEAILNEACHKYNDNPKIAGQRGFRYVFKMAEGISMELQDKPRVNKEAILQETEKQKQSGTQKFSIKLATGNVLDNAIYQKMLTNNSVDELVRLWRMGADILRTENREDELFSDYEWLKLEHEKV